MEERSVSQHHSSAPVGAEVVRAIGQVAAALVAGVGVIYALGGLVLWLRLFLSGKPQLAMVAGLPREVLVSLGLVVVLLSVGIGAFYVLYRLVLRRGPEDPPKQEAERFVDTIGKRPWRTAIWGVVLALPTWGVLAFNTVSNEAWNRDVWDSRWWLVLLVAAGIWLLSCFLALIAIYLRGRLGQEYRDRAALKAADDRSAAGMARDEVTALRTERDALRKRAELARSHAKGAREQAEAAGQEAEAARRQAADARHEATRLHDELQHLAPGDQAAAEEDANAAVERARRADQRATNSADEVIEATGRASKYDLQAQAADVDADGYEQRVSSAEARASRPHADEAALARDGYNRLAAVAIGGLLYAAVAAPSILAATAALPLPEARACVDAESSPIDGEFIGETKDHVYLTDTHGDRVVSVPADKLARLYVGDDARDSDVRCPSPAGSLAEATQAALTTLGSCPPSRLRSRGAAPLADLATAFA